jgi:hypothetical protein
MLIKAALKVQLEVEMPRINRRLHGLRRFDGQQNNVRPQR